MKTRWARPALDDLAHIHDHIADERPAAAVDVVERIERTVEMLARHPSLGRPGRLEGTRELVVTGTPFVIAYRAQDDRIEILSIIHASRKWPDAL